MNWKTYLPDPRTIPAIIILGGFGAVVVNKMLPKVWAWLQAKTPTLQTPPTTPAA
jgi:hypothetical protein